MELPFTHQPGRRERHLRRRHENPLFAWPLQEVEPEVLLAAQKADHDEMESFHAAFRDLLERAVNLPGDADSDTVLGLKQDLERHYEQSFGLPEDHARERAALRKLIDLIMKAVRRSAGSDPLAQQELGDEQQAREIHFRLLEHPLVADLLHPETPIGPDELVPTLLSASAEELEAALELFDLPQVEELAQGAAQLIERLEGEGLTLTIPRQRLAQLLTRLGSDPAPRH
ncbi:MAG: hypothetical protein WAK53_01125 [Chromatiaceae bacterium]|jgi:hypothetical protein